MTWKIIVLLGYFGITSLTQCGVSERDKSEKQRLMDQHTPHPGTIRMIDDYDKSVRLVKAEEVPIEHRFVYFDKAGHEIPANDATAVERIPIVEVRMTPTDGDGHLVPKEQASMIRINEIGPEKRPLRSTTMTKD